MAAIDEEYLAAVYRGLPDKPVKPSDPAYVDPARYPEAFGPDVVTALTRDVTWSSNGSLFFLTGTRGSGKSSQLLRLRDELVAQGWAAVRIEGEEFLNVRTPLEAIELLFAMVGGTTDAVREAGWLSEQGALSRGWEVFASRVRSLRPELSEVALKLPMVDLKGKLVRDPDFVAQLRRHLTGRLSEVATAADTALADLVEALRADWFQRTGGPWKGLVVLFDSLDHVRGTDFAEVRRNLQLLMETQTQVLRLESVRTVFVVPPWISVDSDPRRTVCNIKVADRDGVAFDQGLDALVEAIERRMPDRSVTRLFGSTDRVRALVADSGGHLRDALRLVREAVTSATSLPLDDDVLMRARANVRRGMLPIADDEKAALRYVAEHHEVHLPTQDGWQQLAGLFDRHLILGYQNGEDWYDVHPLVRQDVVSS